MFGKQSNRSIVPPYRCLFGNIHCRCLKVARIEHPLLAVDLELGLLIAPPLWIRTYCLSLTGEALGNLFLLRARVFEPRCVWKLTTSRESSSEYQIWMHDDMLDLLDHAQMSIFMTFFLVALDGK